MAGEQLSAAFSYIAVFGFFFVFLKYLLRSAKKKIKKFHPIHAVDTFLKSNGYSYDYVIVFKVYNEEDDEIVTAFQQKFSLRNVIDRLSHSGVNYKCFYSCQRDEIYIKLRVTYDRFKLEANKIGYRLKLDPDKLKSKLIQGKKGVWKSLIVIDEKLVSPYQPHQYIYGSYTMSEDVRALWQRYPALYETEEMIFKGVDRIKLIISILQSKQSDSPPGCGMNLREMVVKKAVLGQFPLHDYDELKVLQMKWLKLYAYPWSQPVDDIKDYFGERIGLYFLYLQHYTGQLMLPALLGLITFIVKTCYNVSEHFLMPYFTAFMVIWSTFFIEFWKRSQATIAMQWGVTGFEEEEADRPEFEGININSPIDGKKIVYFEEKVKDRRNRIVLVALIMSILTVISVVVSIFIFQVFINQSENASKLTILGINTGSFIVSILNAIVIGVLNGIYGYIAIALNNFENYQRDTEYEDKLIVKVFTFQLVNSYAACTYVSFIKANIGIYCTNNQCVGDVASTLSTIFLTQLVLRALKEFLFRLIVQEQHYAKETDGLEDGMVLSPAEDQYILAEYDVLTGTLSDYAALTIQYGYVILFVAAFPLSPTLAFISSYIQIRVDGWKLCQACRRPRPKIAEDIGVWEDMINVLSSLAVLYNFGIITFTSYYLVNTSLAYRWILFIVMMHVVFCVKYYISEIIDDVPAAVHLQLDRQEAFVNRVLRNLQDEEEDIYVPSNHVTNIIVNDADNDWYEKAVLQDTHPISSNDDRIKSAAVSQ